MFLLMAFYIVVDFGINNMLVAGLNFLVLYLVYMFPYFFCENTK